MIFSGQAEVWMPPEKPKAQLTVRFDADIVDWFRKQGRGYQTRMNAVLRAYENPARPQTRAQQSVEHELVDLSRLEKRDPAKNVARSGSVLSP